MPGAAPCSAVPVETTFCELADIFEQYNKAYQLTHRVTTAHARPYGRLPIAEPPPWVAIASGARLADSSGTPTTVAATAIARSVRARPRPPGWRPARKNSCRCRTFTMCSPCHTS